MKFGLANEDVFSSSIEKLTVVQNLFEITSISKSILNNFSFVELRVMEKEIVTDPWKFWDKTRGFTLNTLDKSAKATGITNFEDCLSRCCAVYRERLYNMTYESGNTYTLRHNFEYRLNIPKQTIPVVEEVLIKAGHIVIKNDKIYEADLYYSEFQIALTIHKLLENKNNFLPYKKSPNYEILEKEQKEVVDAITENNFVIMTGYPGTGKTKTISVIAEMFENTTLVAPTGKAARRITEMSGLEARTIHSITLTLNNIGMNLSNTLIIIDESSMMDVDIAGSFFEHIDASSCKLLIVGDTCQLPSVGPGQILKDLTESKCCVEEKLYKHIQLTKIKRQEPGSIILSAHAIANGQDIVKLDDGRVKTYCYRNQSMTDIAKQIAGSSLWTGAQFLTVLRDRCSDVINPVIQNVVNPGTTKWRVGDRVIHLKNDRNNGVMNGDMGVVIEVKKNGFLAKYQNAEMFYTPAIEWMVSLAYAFTVHKSQGSEFDKVVLFMNKSRITNRNILYTGLTRAINKILIVSEDEDTVWDAIDTLEQPRLTTLRFLL